jgi:PAS domain S-box-containing protein
MNWIDIVWPMMGAASLTLGLIHLLVWFKQGRQTAHLMFALTAMSVAAVAIFELLMMPGADAGSLRRCAALGANSIHGDDDWHRRLRAAVPAGRQALARRARVQRAPALLLPNFLTGVNLNFTEITALRQIPVWGGHSVVAPVGVANPWTMLGLATVVLLLIFLLDALVSGVRNRRGEDRRRLILVCGSMLAFMLFSTVWLYSVISGALHAPVTVNPAFLAVLLAMSYELGGDVLRAAQLAQSLSVSEAQLRDTEQRMEMAVRGARVGLWSRDLVHEDSWVSETGMHLLGFGAAEKWDRDRFYQRLPPADRDKLQAAVAEAIRGSGEFDTEYRITGSDGRIRWIMVRGQVEIDADRKPLRMRGVLSEITERRQAEETLRLVVETSPTALLIVNTQGLITLVNCQAETVFAYSRDELVGMSVDSLVPRRYHRPACRRRARYGSSQACGKSELGATCSHCARTAARFRSKSRSIPFVATPACPFWSRSPTLPNASAPSLNGLCSATNWRTCRGSCCWPSCPDRSHTN